MRRVLLWSFGTLLVLLGAAIAALLLVDLSQYRAVVESQTSAALGRRVAIAGDLEIKTSLTPTLAANRVTIANVPGGSREQMARIGRLEIGLELLPLLGGDIRITHVAMVEADIVLETGDDGRGNWLFVPGGIDADVPEARPDPDTQAPFIGLLELSDTVVSHTGIGGRTRRLDIARARLATASEDDDIEIEVDCIIDGQPIHATATTGSLATLLAGNENWPVRMALSIGKSRVSVVGTIADPTTFARYSAAFDAEMASAEPFAVLLDRDLPALPAISIDGSIAGNAGEVRLSQLSATFGDSDIGGDLTLSLGGGRPVIAGELSSRRLDLTEVMTGAPEPSADATADPAIQVAALAAADVDLRLQVDELVLPDLVISGIRGGVRLDDRRLDIAIEQARLYDGALTADLGLDGRVRPPTAALDMQVGQIDLGALLRDQQLSDAVTGNADAVVALAAKGVTRQAMIASAAGRMTMNVGPGRITSTLAGLVGRSFVTALLPIGDADTVELQCAVGNFDVAYGVATSTALLVDSQRATVAGEGAIDFVGNRLDLVFNPRAKDPNLLALVAPVRVHGPLDRPVVSVLAGDLVVNTATDLVLGVINPIAIIVPFVTAGVGDENPCLAALNDDMTVEPESAPGRLIGGAVDAVGGVAEGAVGITGGVAGGARDAAAGVGGALGDVGRGIGDALGGIFGGGGEPTSPTEN